MVAVAHFPGSLDRGPLDRARRPLAAVAAIVLVVDLIGLGLHLADAIQSPFANDTPSPVRARIGGSEAVVPGSDVLGSRLGRTPSSSGRAAQPYGCLSASSGCYAGPTAPGAPAPGNTSTPPTATPKPVPAAQADFAVPSLGAQVSVGAGDGACNTIDLTVIALGDCPAPAGEGPIVVNLGGSLLGD